MPRHCLCNNYTHIGEFERRRIFGMREDDFSIRYRSVMLTSVGLAGMKKESITFDKDLNNLKAEVAALQDRSLLLLQNSYQKNNMTLLP